MFFPLPFIPPDDYHAPPAKGGAHRYFGAGRPIGANPPARRHAACDLMAPPRTDIYAVDDGEVVELLPAFNHGTGVIALRHTEGYIVRYCEVMNESISGVELKQRFKAGDVIAKVGQMNTLTMLHFEMYSGTAEGKLGAKYPNIYQRRPDLIDPTPFLDKLRNFVGVCHPPAARILAPQE